MLRKECYPVSNNLRSHDLVARTKTEDGRRFLGIGAPLGQSGHLGVWAWKPEYSVSNYPVISFDFRASARTEVDLLFDLKQPRAGTKGIGLTDKEPYYPRLAHAWTAQADGEWHHVEVNLLTILRRRLPSQRDYQVQEICFADWNGGDRLFATKFYGPSSRRRGGYAIDNFAITRYGPTDRLTLRWSARDDSGIAGYTCILDREADTVPAKVPIEGWPDKMQAQRYRKPVPGEAQLFLGEEGQLTYEGLQDARWWFHVRARDKCGNWGPANHYLHVVDTQPPEVKSATAQDRRIIFGEDIRVMFTDNGAGVDASSLVVVADGRKYRVNGSSLAFDPGTQAISLRFHRLEPCPRWFVDEYPLKLSLKNVTDLAGHQMPSEPCWVSQVTSPVSVRPADITKNNGWLHADPQISLQPHAREKWTWRWMRELNGDTHADDGCHIREVGLFATREPNVPEEKPERHAKRSPDDPPDFVAEIKVDRTIPRTKIRVTELPPTDGMQGGAQIELSHTEYAYRRGGLRGTYYRSADFRDRMCQRVDASANFHDDRTQFTSPVPGAHSAIWEGAVYIPETTAIELELAIWRRAPASGRVLIDGKVILELLPVEMASVGYKKKRVLLVQGLHELRMEFSDPSSRMWSFALFCWGKGKKGEDIRDIWGPKELYYLENLGTTNYRWNDEPFQVYTEPLVTPRGKNVLQFYTVDRAGHKEEVQTREFIVEDAAAGVKLTDDEED